MLRLVNGAWIDDSTLPGWLEQAAAIRQGNYVADPRVKGSTIFDPNADPTAIGGAPYNAEAYGAARLAAPVEDIEAPIQDALLPFQGFDPINVEQPFQGFDPINVEQPFQGFDPINVEQPFQGFDPINVEQPFQGFDPINVEQGNWLADAFGKVQGAAQAFDDWKNSLWERLGVPTSDVKKAGLPSGLLAQTGLALTPAVISGLTKTGGGTMATDFNWGAFAAQMAPLLGAVGQAAGVGKAGSTVGGTVVSRSRGIVQVRTVTGKIITIKTKKSSRRRYRSRGGMPGMNQLMKFAMMKSMLHVVK